MKAYLEKEGIFQEDEKPLPKNLVINSSEFNNCVQKYALFSSKVVTFL